MITFASLASGADSTSRFSDPRACECQSLEAAAPFAGTGAGVFTGGDVVTVGGGVAAVTSGGGGAGALGAAADGRGNGVAAVVFPPGSARGLRVTAAGGVCVARGVADVNGICTGRDGVVRATSVGGADGEAGTAVIGLAADSAS